MNKFLLVLIALSLILSVTSLIVEIPFADSYIFLAIFGNLAILIMLVNGTFITTKLFTAAKFAIGLIVLGAIFKIMHLNGGDEIILVSNLGLLATYVVHFFRKSPKEVLDFFKVLMIMVIAIRTPLVMLHLISEQTIEILDFATVTLTLITFATFFYSLIRERKLSGD